MEQKVRIGMVARCDNSGLGILTLDFFKNFYVDKVLVVSGAYQNYLDRFDGYRGTKTVVCERGTPSIAEIEEFLKDLDLVVCFETPYNWNVFSMAKAKGVKTALMVMYEWTPTQEKMPVEPDMFLCPSLKDFEELWGNTVYIPVPINRELVPFKERTEAKTFIFNNGHGGYAGRNSITEFIQALPFIKSDIKIKIRSQVYFESINDSRVEVEMGDLPYKKLWTEGDIYVHLHKFDGLSLPINEAMSAGLPIIAPDFSPHNKFLPKELLFPVEGFGTINNNIRLVETAVLSPIKIAEKIDEVAAMPNEKIKELSNRMNVLAEKWSWKNLKAEYVNAFNSLCGKL